MKKSKIKQTPFKYSLMKYLEKNEKIENKKNPSGFNVSKIKPFGIFL